MLVTTLRRDVLMSMIPHKGIGAEVGVYRCNFSKQILEANDPSKLHLIDPWEDDGEYVRTYNARDDMSGLYANAQTLFAEEIKTGKVELHRDFSYNAANDFADGSLDWAYIDGMHTYEAVKADLEVFAPKVAQAGFLLGHDFSNSPDSRRRGFGVVQAVREFVEESEFEIAVLTYENAASYVLARAGQASALANLTEQILQHPNAMNFEIDAAALAGFDQLTVEVGNKIKRPHYRFGPAQPDADHGAQSADSKKARRHGFSLFSNLRR